MTMQLDLIPAVTDVQKQEEAPDLLREPEVDMKTAFLTDKDNPKNREDLAV